MLEIQLMNPYLNICSSIFTVGQSRMCNLRLEDPSVSTTLCKVKRIEHGGAPTALLEISGSKGVVLVNGKSLGKNSKIILAGGVEVVFSSSGKYAYIFQQLTNESLNTPLLPPSLGISDAVGSSVKGIQFGNHSADPSAFDGASILASLSNPRNDGSVIASPALNDENVQRGLERPTPSSPEFDSNCHVLKGCSELNGNTGIPSADNTAAVVSADLPSNNPFHLGLDARLDAVLGKNSGANCELRPLLQMLAGSSTSELDLSGSVLNAFEDPSELHKHLDLRTNVNTPESRQLVYFHLNPPLVKKNLKLKMSN